MPARKSTKRVKKSGIVYLAVNSRIPNMVKIGMTTDTAEKRLEYANRKNEFMCGVWSITHKVRTNDAKRTESLAHTLFEEFHDTGSISKEMYYIPQGMKVKDMADLIRDKDRIYAEHMKEERRAKQAVEEAQAKLKSLNLKHKEELTVGVPSKK